MANFVPDELRLMVKLPSTISLTPGLERCSTCIQDRQKCSQTKDPSRCDRCIENSYLCSLHSNKATESEGKRRKLSRIKCEQCRSAKQKCQPEDRIWDGTPETRCNRCKERDLLCSPSQTSAQESVIPRQVRTDVEYKSPSIPPNTMLNIMPNIMPPLSHIMNPEEMYYNGSNGSSTTYVQGSVATQARQSARSATWNGSPTRFDTISPHRSATLGSEYPYVTQYSDGSLEYRYTPLQKNEIRLLELHPIYQDRDVSANLVHFRLDAENLRYVALSYCWGNHFTEKAIKIGGLAFSVRPNLYDALKTLCPTNAPRYLWIDAICINQKDKRERSEQVSLMSRIYNKAEEVIAWLGIGSEDENTALIFLSELLNLSQFDQTIEKESEKWKAVEKLLDNKCFTRRWVLQDIALARNASLQCGREMMPWEDFADSIKILEARAGQETNLKKNASFLSRDHTHRALPAMAFLDATQSIFKKSADGTIMESLCSLELLVSSTVEFEANDPLDTIYTMLSLAKNDNGIVANYNKDVLELYSEYVEQCIATSGSLDIICRHWAHIPPRKKAKYRENPNDMLPSWIKSVLGSPFATFEDVSSTSRLCGNSFVGLPNLKRYNASMGMKVELANRISTRKIIGTTDLEPQIYRVLPVNGLRVSKIQELGERAVHGIIPSGWLELGGWVSSEHIPSDLPDRLWRTLVADRDPNGLRAPGWYKRACIHCFGLRPSQDPDISTERMIKSGSTPSLVKEFLKRVQSVIWNRKFFNTERINGRETSGLAPTNSKVGDLVCILFGCSVPVLLRELDDGYYKLVGEIYVHEMMDGQASAGIASEDILQFELR